MSSFDSTVRANLSVAAVAPPGSGGLGDEALTKWYTVYTTSRHEKRITEHCDQREIEHFLPLYTTRRRWKDGTKPILQLPLFPSYLFVHIAFNKRAGVLGIPGVLSIVGYGREPFPVPDLYIHSLREGIRLDKVEPHPYLAVGDRVRIKAGAMEGVEGILVRKKNSLRVVLTLELIRQSVAVEVDIDDVERIGRKELGARS